MRLGPALSMLFFACPSAEPSAHEFPPDIVLERATVQQYRGSSPQLVARTPSLSYYRQGAKAGSISATDVVVEIRDNGLHIEADSVTGDANAALLDGTQVRATTPSGVVVTSPAARFDGSRGASGTATTDAGVVVVHPAFTLQAQSGSMDIAEARASLEAVHSQAGHR